MRLILSLRAIVRNFDTIVLSPHSTDPDKFRQEYILNILLSALASITIVALLIFIVHGLTGGLNDASITPTAIFAMLLVGLIIASRKGHSLAASYIFLSLLSVAAIQLLLQWSFELPQTNLLFALDIVIAGVLLSARATLYASAIVGILIVLVGREQALHHLHPNLSWLKQSFTIGDAISYGGVLVVIGVVSWLSNREIDRSLIRARASELALAIERDNLEIKVINRTRELEQTQLMRTLELQRLAEFGRINANLLHEISNPLTAASLNLEQLDEQESDAIMQVQSNIERLKLYVNSARRQLESEVKIETFNVSHEINQVMLTLAPIAKQSNVLIKLSCSDKIQLRGDSVKFNQIIGNIIANGIDSYNNTSNNSNRKMIINAVTSKNYLNISISNNGEAIPNDNLQKIFDQFFTTKHSGKKGLGLGLAMVKQFVEADFKGSVKVNSTENITTFELKLRSKNTN